jgi:Ca-activated chloride channel family protein
MRIFSTLPGLLLLLLLALPTVASPPDALGPRRAPDEMGAGGLLFKTADGLREAPTLATDVEITITGMIARTRVTQRFANPTRDWVEGVYVFPLPEGSAVDSLEMHVGDRVIKGHVEERARARATYRKAKSEGRKASLVEQERPNLFTTSIANLGPDEEVEVILTYQEDVRYDQGRFSLRFPMVVAPRFIPGNAEIEGFSGTGWAQNTQAVPDASRITPPVSAPTRARSHPVTLQVEIDAGFPLAEVESSSHPVLVRAAASNAYHVRLDGGPVQANADFLLDWVPAIGAAPGAALFREEWQGEHYALLMVLPPPPDAAATSRVSRETIIVIDTSGSMSGESIAEARRAVDFALGTLRPEDAFNVIRFDSTVRGLFDGARPATSESVEAARRWVGQLQADGGTNMLPAIEAALTPSDESRAVRQVIFVTDGAVGNESELFGAIQRLLGPSRLFTVGIGSAPNSHFMSKAAEFGRGTFTYISQPSEVAAKMGALFRKIASPLLHDLEIDWEMGGVGGTAARPVEAWPRRIPDIYVGEPVVVAVRLPKDGARGASKARLRGRRGGEDVTIELPLEGGSNHQGIAKLWARRKIADLMNSLQDGESIDRVSVEVASLGVRHQLVTRWSSLVAVDVTPTAPVRVTPETRAVPSLLPRGWDFFKVFGRRDREATAPEQQKARRGRDAGMPRAAAAGTPSGIRPVTINQPIASVNIGRLPQGATPSSLLLSIGGMLLGGAGLLWRGNRGNVRQCQVLRPNSRRSKADHGAPF